MFAYAVLLVLLIEPPTTQPATSKPAGESLEQFIKRVAPMMLQAHDREAPGSKIIKGSASSLTNSLRLRADINAVATTLAEQQVSKAIASRRKEKRKLTATESAFIEFADLMNECLDLPRRFTLQIQAAKDQDAKLDQQRKADYWQRLRAHENPKQPVKSDKAAKVVSAFTNRLKAIEGKYDKYMATLRAEVPAQEDKKLKRSRDQTHTPDQRPG